MGHLISLEDNLLGLPHLHKLLGVLALCFSLNFLAKGGLDVDAQPWLVRCALVVHTTLALSAFIFKNVQKKSTVAVMDQLYRAQVLVFTARSVGVMAVVLCYSTNIEQNNGSSSSSSSSSNTIILTEQQQQIYLRMLVVLLSHKATDWCKDRFGNDGKTRGVRRPLRGSDFQGGSNGDAGTKRAISIGRYASLHCSVYTSASAYPSHIKMFSTSMHDHSGYCCHATDP